MSRMKSRSSSRRSAPILYWMPGDNKEAEIRPPRYAPRPSSRVAMVRTGQLYHLFVDEVYVDTFTSPAISDGYQSQAKEAHVQAAVARV